MGLFFYLYAMRTTHATLTTPPVSLDQVKAFCRADSDLDDNLLDGLNKSATDEFYSLSGYMPGSWDVVVVQTFAYEVVITTPRPILPAPSTVTVDGSALTGSQYTYHEPTGTLTINAEVPEGQTLAVSFLGVGDKTPPHDITLAILQKVKEAYDYGDNLEWKSVRAFDRIAYRYREDFAH